MKTILGRSGMQGDQGYTDVRRDSEAVAVQLQRALHRLEQRERQDVIQDSIRANDVVAVQDPERIWNSNQKKKVSYSFLTWLNFHS